MKKVLVTGSNGFVGKNLCTVLRRREDVELYEYDIDNKPVELHLQGGRAFTGGRSFRAFLTSWLAESTCYTLG